MAEAHERMSSLQMASQGFNGCHREARIPLCAKPSKFYCYPQHIYKEIKSKRNKLINDKLTGNLLVLELATMVIAIALAFNAESLVASDLVSIIRFVVITALVVWFWWIYVADRLEFPPKTMAFPLIDVLILILIAIIPVIIRQGITAISVFFAVLLLLWGRLIKHMILEYNESISDKRRRDLRREELLRYAFATLLVVNAVVGIISPLAGELIFYALIVVLLLLYILTRFSRLPLPHIGQNRDANV